MKFQKAIEITTTNYLSTIFPQNIENQVKDSAGVSESKKEKITVSSADYAYWESGGHPYARLNGVDIKSGDFVDKGVVVSISPSSIFIRGFEDGCIYVVKNFTPSTSRLFRGEERNTEEREGDGEKSL